MFARAKLGAVVGLCAVSTVLLAACGGATSDGGSSESSAVAPLSKSARATESSEKSPRCPQAGSNCPNVTRITLRS